MEWQLFAQLAVTFLVAMLGWWVAHYFASQRDLANERRKLRTLYLLEAYRNIAKAHSLLRPKSGCPEEGLKLFETVVSDVQLLGSPAQVKMAKDIANRFVNTNFYDFDELVEDLRKSLRKELMLEEIKEPIVALRFNLNQ